METTDHVSLLEPWITFEPIFDGRSREKAGEATRAPTTTTSEVIDPFGTE